MAQKAYKKELTPKQEAVLLALEKSMGSVTLAARSVNISRSTFYRWLSESEEFKRGVSEVDDVIIDFVEAKLYQKINDGDTLCTIFFLKSKGRARGWNEKFELSSAKEEKPVKLHPGAQDMVEATKQKMALIEGCTLEELKELKRLKAKNES